MRRTVTHRIELRGQLTCTSALSVGGWGEGAFADIVVSRDTRGRPVVPGTSLAGALRAWYARGHGVEEADRLFGYVRQVPASERQLRGTSAQHEARASRIRVDDALVDVHDRRKEVAVEVRDGVSIDRHTGTAQDQKLFTREVLPVGTTFPFVLTAEEGSDEHVQRAVEELGSALARGEVTLGGRTSQGLGRVVLNQATLSVSPVGSRDGLLAWLRDGARPEPFEPGAGTTVGILRVEVDWRPEHAVLVRDSAGGRGVDVLPLTTTDPGGRVRLLIPGSTVKGCLRAQAERIVRSLIEADDAPAAADDRRIASGPRLLPAVTGLFGAGPSDLGAGDLSSGYRGTVTAHDCHSSGHLDVEDWDAVRWAAPKPAAGRGQEAQAPPAAEQAQPDRDRETVRRLARDLTGPIRFAVSDHVAVDRWTGGAAEGRLCSLLEPMGTAWQPIILTVDSTPRRPSSGAGDRQEPADPDLLDPDLQLTLLLLVLRDLADGWIPLGSATTRGLGHLTARRITFHGEGLGDPWSDLPGRTLDDVLAHRPPAVERAWSRWLRRVAPTAEGR